MSVINKKPFIKTLLESLNDSDLATLRTMIDGGGDQSVLLRTTSTTYNNSERSRITNSDKGVHRCSLEVQNGLYTWNGYLIFNNSHCVLIYYTNNFQSLGWLKVDADFKGIEYIGEELSVLELRSELDDTAESEKAEIIEVVNDAVEEGDINGNLIIEFKNVAMAQSETGSAAALTVTSAQWTKAANKKASPVARFTLTSGVVIELPRVEQNSDATRIWFGGKVGETNYYAVLNKNGSSYSGNLYQTDLAHSATGSAIYLIGVDSEGNIVKDELPEGIVVDNELDASSNNAIANKAVTEALEKKANVDGNYPTMTVGVADQLSPYDDESGDDQDEPFSFQATGTGNGSQPDFSTGSIALMKEKQGNTVVVNQLAKELNNTNWSATDASVTYDAGVATFTATAQNGSITQSSISIPSGHKILLIATIKTTTATNQVYLEARNSPTAIQATTSWQNVSFISNASPNSSGYIFIGIRDNRTSDWDAIQVKDVLLIDLTQWFNGDIPQDLLDHPEHFFRYYQGSLAYNTGELVNADGRYIKCIGRQQWDEVWELGYYNNDGTPASSSNNIRSKNAFRVIPNSTYYFRKATGNYPNSFKLFFMDNSGNVISTLGITGNETFTIPSNCTFMKFMSYATVTTYNNDITISIYYEDEGGYDQYYPYEVLTNNDTGTETLRRAGSAKDVKLPSGEITRNIGSVDLGTASWSYNPSYGFYISGAISSLVKIPSTVNDKPNAIAEKYQVTKQGGAHENGELLITADGNVWVKVDSSSDPTPTGILFYELATPTTEQGTSFSENLVIDDFGSQEFSGTSGVPQGALIFYPVDYKAFIDTLYDYTDGTPSNLAKKTDISSFFANISGYDATKTQTLKNVNGTLTWVDDE